MLVEFIKDNAPDGGTVVTGEFKAYRTLPDHGFTHKTVRHSVGEYVRDMATQTASKASVRFKSAATTASITT